MVKFLTGSPWPSSAVPITVRSPQSLPGCANSHAERTISRNANFVQPAIVTSPVDCTALDVPERASESPRWWHCPASSIGATCGTPAVTELFATLVRKMRLTHTILLILCLSNLFAQDKRAQEKSAQDKPILVPQMQLPVLQGSIAAFKSMPPDITLIPHGEGARNGHLWVRNLGFALVIAGEVDGDAPDFPKNQNWILSKDHIEVWLVASTDVAMPEIGWGNQFDQNEFPKGQDSCADFGKNGMGAPDTLPARQKKCRDWVGTQQRYRPRIQASFHAPVAADGLLFRRVLRDARLRSHYPATSPATSLGTPKKCRTC